MDSKWKWRNFVPSQIFAPHYGGNVTGRGIPTSWRGLYLSLWSAVLRESKFLQSYTHLLVRCDFTQQQQFVLPISGVECFERARSSKGAVLTRLLRSWCVWIIWGWRAGGTLVIVEIRDRGKKGGRIRQTLDRLFGVLLLKHQQDPSLYLPSFTTRLMDRSPKWRGSSLNFLQNLNCLLLDISVCGCCLSRTRPLKTY